MRNVSNYGELKRERDFEGCPSWSSLAQKIGRPLVIFKENEINHK